MGENKGIEKLFKEYRLHFGLTQNAVEQLAKLKKNQYSRFESGRQKPRPHETKAVASIYGLEDYQLMNPNQRKPSLKSLPIKTQHAILNIRKSGTQPREKHEKIDLGKEIDKLIATGKLSRPITAKRLLELLPIAVREEINNESRRITDLLKRPPRCNKVKVVEKPEGETGAGNWYQIKE
ncbi:Helix-turn-helix domain-containing protein [Parapedobacter luteus]|uniref:Helix-turn-helix domain-containing protein n=1 Tax=Parapedobacter luteus TaxID=623280 RepID=A0A1T5CTD6_9SPHI|nr:helix-turn-helix transcriptional regulator [Parapedobacter luteus]SKB62755.1 Helix-turn-helix domain-containing protein [Parapedobacter luteus]